MTRDRLHVVIAGGGVAAVESLLALRELAGRRVQITLLSPERRFLYRPVTVAEAFDRDEAHSALVAGREDRRTIPRSVPRDRPYATTVLRSESFGDRPRSRAPRTHSSCSSATSSKSTASGSGPQTPLDALRGSRHRFGVNSVAEHRSLRCRLATYI